MKFEVIGDIREVELIARGAGVKIRAYLRKAYKPWQLAHAQGDRDGSNAKRLAADSRTALVRSARDRKA